MSNQIANAEALCNKTFPVKLSEAEAKLVYSKDSLDNVLNYIYKMGPALNIDLTKKKLGQFGAVIDGKFYPQESVTKINEELVKDDTIDDVEASLSEALIDRVKNFEENYVGFNKQYLAEKTARSRRRAQDAYEKHMACQREYRQELIKLRESATSMPDFTSVMKEAVKDPFWEVYTEPYDQGICIITKAPVVIDFSNESQGIETTMNFGRLNFRINTSCQVYPLSGDKRIDLGDDGTFYHPHISSNKICWGEYYGDYDDAVGDSDLLAIMVLLKEIVTTYNDDDPYVNIGEWIAKYQPENCDAIAALTVRYHECEECATEIEYNLNIREENGPLECDGCGTEQEYFVFPPRPAPVRQTTNHIAMETTPELAPMIESLQDGGDNG